MVDISDLPSPSNNVDISDLPSPTKKVAGSKLPSRLEIKPPEAASGKVPETAKSIIDYFTEVPNKEDFSLGETATSGGIGATIAGAGPKILEKGSKLVGKFLPAPVKPFAYAGEALGKALGEIPLSKRLAVGGVSTAGGNVAQQAGELAGLPRAVTLPLSLGVGGLMGKGTALTYDALSGLPQKEAAALVSKLTGEQSTLRAELNRLTSQLKEVPTPQRQDEINRLNVEIAKRDQALQQLKQQPKVAKGRTKTQMQAPTGEGAMLPSRAEVQSQLGAKVAETKTNLAKATDLQTLAQGHIDNIEQEILAKPQMNASKFGEMLRSAAKSIKEFYNPLRIKAADYEGVFSKASKNPDISTNSIVNSIDTEIANSGDPAKTTFLNTLKSQLMTGDEIAVNLPKAHSAKGFLDRMVVGNQEKDFMVNKDIAFLARKYKTQLLKNAVGKYKDYGKALSEFRKASRPLDIVEQRTGATVSNILDENTLSKESKLADAQVAGAVIAKANQGHEVMSRLLKESPELKDASRLYFTQDLFGKGEVPSANVFSTWLKSNENSLRQTGLYDEFSSLATARKSAKEAVDFANDRVSQAAHDKQIAELLHKESAKRTKEAIAQQPKAKAILAENQAEAQKAKTRLESEKGKSQAEIDKINREESTRMTTESNALNAEKQQIELLIGDVVKAKKSPKEVASTVANLARSMKQKGLIDDAGRQELEEAAYKLTGTIQQKAEAVAKLKRFAKYTALGTAAAVGIPYSVRQAGGGLLP